MNKTLTTILSIIIVLLSVVSGFFAWQNQRLVKNIRLAMPTPTAIPSPNPVPTPTPDEKASWKEYADEKLKLTFKAPFEMNVKVIDNLITIQNYPFGAPPPNNYYKATIIVADGVIDKITTLKGDKTITDQIIATFIWQN